MLELGILLTLEGRRIARVLRLITYLCGREGEMILFRLYLRDQRVCRKRWKVIIFPYKQYCGILLGIN